MRGREGVVDVEVAERRQRLDEIADRSSPRRCGSGCSRAEGYRRPSSPRPRLRRLRPMQSSAKATGRPSTSRQRRATGFSDMLPGRAPSAGRNGRAGSTLPPLSAISLIVGATRSNARVVGDLAVLHRHVEVDAHEHALALDVGVVERAEALMRAGAPRGRIFAASHRATEDGGEEPRSTHRSVSQSEFRPRRSRRTRRPSASTPLAHDDESSRLQRRVGHARHRRLDLVAGRGSDPGLGASRISAVDPRRLVRRSRESWSRPLAESSRAGSGRLPPSGGRSRAHGSPTAAAQLLDARGVGTGSKRRLDAVRGRGHRAMGLAALRLRVRESSGSRPI